MAKVMRKGLEEKLAALEGDDWDSMSESEDEELAKITSPVHSKVGGKSKANKKGGKGFSKNNVEGGRRVGSGGKGSPSSVIYIGHIPHGFYEEAMNGFFGQFGEVVKCRVSRSKKTARSKGYAFVQFSAPEVASIVAETMNGYFIYDKQLVCEVMAKDDLHPGMFDGAGKTFKKINWHSINRQKFNKDKTIEEDAKQVRNLLKKEKAKRKKLEALGISFDFPGFKASLQQRKTAAPELEKATMVANDTGNEVADAIMELKGDVKKCPEDMVVNEGVKKSPRSEVAKEENVEGGVKKSPKNRKKRRPSSIEVEP